MRNRGMITNWKDDRGFGFVTPSDGGPKVFIHIKSFARYQRRPVENEIVTYEVQTDVKGRLQAENVLFLNDSISLHSRARDYKIPLIFCTFFLTFLIWAVFVDKLPFAIIKIYLITSTITFIAYALDKAAAENVERRTRERTLHFFSLVGGWPGALAAQRLLHHKSKKKSFQIGYWVTVFLNCVAIGWLTTPSGVNILHSILVTF